MWGITTLQFKKNVRYASFLSAYRFHCVPFHIFPLWNVECLQHDRILINDIIFCTRHGSNFLPHIS